jgi:hypothetical protein
VRAICAVAALALVPAASSAQLTGGARVERYTFGDAARAGFSSMELRSIPIDLHLAMGPLRLDGSGGIARGWATSAAGVRTQLDGLSDLEIGLGLVGAGGRFMVRGSVSPESGPTLSAAQSGVAALFASELLPFSPTRWGAGASVGADVALFVPTTNGLDLTVDVGVRAPQSRELLPDEPGPYQAGRELRGRASIGTRVGRAGRFAASLGVQAFTSDSWGSAEVYRSGTRVDGIVSLATPLGLERSAVFYGGYHRRFPGKLLSKSPLFTAVIGSPGEQTARAGVRGAFTRGRVAWLPDGEVRIARSSGVVCYRSGVSIQYEVACPAEQGWLGTTGMSLDLALLGTRTRPLAVLTPSAHVRMGELVALDGEASDPTGLFVTAQAGPRSPVTGWDVGLALRIGAGR